MKNASLKDKHQTLSLSSKALHDIAMPPNPPPSPETLHFSYSSYIRITYNFFFLPRCCFDQASLHTGSSSDHYGTHNAPQAESYFVALEATFSISTRCVFKCRKEGSHIHHSLALLATCFLPWSPVPPFPHHDSCCPPPG